MAEIVKLEKVNVGTATPIEIMGETFLLLVDHDGPGTVSVVVSEHETIEGGDDQGDDNADANQ